jgi:glutaredoxin
VAEELKSWLRSRAGWWSLLLVLGLSWGIPAGWRHHQQAGWAQALVEHSRPGDIRLLSSAVCLYCDRARSWLQAHQIPFDECFIETDAICRDRYEATGARGTPTVLVRDQAQLGFDAQRVARTLGAAL